MTFSEVYAPYKNLFGNIIKADALPTATTSRPTSPTSIPFSACRGRSSRGAPDQLILVPNEAYWGPEVAERRHASSWSRRPTATPRSPRCSRGESDFIFPQAYRRHHRRAERPEHRVHARATARTTRACTSSSVTAPFADDDFREAFPKSIDRDLILAQHLRPDLPGWPAAATAASGSRRSVRGATTPSFDGQLRPRRGAATASSTDAGWTKNGDGMWAKDGDVPEIRWIINSGNTRRESTQALMIPELHAGRLQRHRRQLRRRLLLPAASASARLRPGDVHQHRLARTRRSPASCTATRSRPRRTATRVRTRPVGATRTPRR